MNTSVNGTTNGKSIEYDIHKIRLYIEDQLKEKQDMLKQKDRFIHELENKLLSKDISLSVLEEKLDHQQHETDGNRQLINKLLGDISKLQNDIEWYKRTYEKRSFFGIVKELSFRMIKKNH
jgi:peptidoglycan hydrolase CwlO-like protein